jgi:putative flavoprotein involved in K+ transport
MEVEHATERCNTVVIGAGQAGLSVGYHLQKQRIPFIILEAHSRVGDSWRKRWDSLRLFTPARFDSIDGMRFPGPANYFPTKDEMANFLEDYSRRFQIPVRTGTTVERVDRSNGHYVVSSSNGTIEAKNVVVAMASYQKPRVPAYASDLDPAIVQMHSSEYRNRLQLRDGGVLLVGAGNSGAEIAVEVGLDRKTWMSGRDVGHIPFDIGGLASRLVLGRLLLRLVFHRILTTDTPIGRKVRAKGLTMGGPLIRQRPRDLAAAHIERVPRVVGVKHGRPLLEDGRVLQAENVIWCTGFQPGFSWIDLPVHGDHEPLHRRGIVETEPGLYFVGLHFLYAFSSTMIHGVGRDAAYIARMIAARGGGS